MFPKTFKHFFFLDIVLVLCVSVVLFYNKFVHYKKKLEGMT